MSKRFLSVLTLALLAAALIGWSLAQAPADGNTGIADVDWRLSAIDGEPVLPPNRARPSLRIEGDGVAGNGSCNRYAGPVALSGDGGIRFGALASTRMACADPVGSQEQRFFQALSQARFYLIVGQELRLFGAGETLVFTAP